MEIQDEPPRVRIPLDCIGFMGVRRRIIVESIDKIALDVEIDVCVSIPDDRRGAHLSRNCDAISDAIGGIERAASIEDYLESIAERLMEKHAYAARAVATLRTKYYVNTGFAGINGVEPVDVEASISLARGSRQPYRKLKVGLYGMTVCPSAQERIARIYGYNKPAPSHSQKAYLAVEINYRGNTIVRIEELARAASKAFSAPTFSLLKREPEARLVYAAHRNPLFAEDVVRNAVAITACLLGSMKMPEDTAIKAEIVSFESIHPHNVYASSTVSLGEALKIVECNANSLDYMAILPL